MSEEKREKTERALKLIAEGSEEGVDLLYECMGGVMFFIAKSVVKDRFVAEEVVQDSFLKVVKSISAYKRGTNGYAWVCRIVRNTALNALKASHPYEDMEIISNRPAGEDEEERAAVRFTVEKLLDSLYPPVVRQMIVMKYFMDMTVREIAKEIGKSKSYVAKEISKAENFMRELLKDRWTD